MAFQGLGQIGLGWFLQSEALLPPATERVPQETAPQEKAPQEERKTDVVTRGVTREVTRGVAREQFSAITAAGELEGAFSIFSAEVQTLILQATSFDHWYDRDLQRMLLVNKSWQSLFHSALLEYGDNTDTFVSQILAKAGFDLQEIDPSVKAIVLGDRCRKKVQRLELEGDQLTDEKLLAICTHFPNLKILKLAFAPDLTDVGIRNAVLRYPNLIELKVTNNTLTDASLLAIAEKCTELQRVDLRDCAQSTARGVLALVQQSPKLSHLSFENLSGADQLLEILPQSCPRLTHLEVRRCPSITARQFIAYFESRPKLIHLDISLNRERLTDEVLISIGQNCPNLTSIDVSGNNAFTEHGIKAFLESYPPESCPLEYLDLSYTNVSDVMLQTVGALARQLKVIRLQGSQGITDAGVCSVVEKCLLRVLDLRYCGMITDKTLEAVGRYQRDLEDLDIACCALLSQEGFEAFILQCTKLKQVTLASIQKITITASLAKAMAENLPHLRKLWIRQPISSQALVHILHSATQLTGLSICGPEITDKELELIAEKYKKLRRLAIRDGSVTSRGLRHFLQRCWLLKQMGCFENRGTITDDEKAALRRDFPLKCEF